MELVHLGQGNGQCYVIVFYFKCYLLTFKTVNNVHKTLLQKILKLTKTTSEAPSFEKCVFSLKLQNSPQPFFSLLALKVTLMVSLPLT